MVKPTVVPPRRGSGGHGGSTAALFNKRPKVWDFLLFFFLSVVLLLLAGRGGKGRDGGVMEERGFGDTCGFCAHLGRKLPPHLLAEGWPFSSSISSAFDAERRHSPHDGDGWAVSAASTTVLAERRPAVALLGESHFLLPPGIMPLLRPWFSFVVAACHDALAVPSGYVTGDGEVDFERSKGSDRVPKSGFVVLPANVQGPVCNFVFSLGPVVSRCVTLAIY